MHYQNSRECLQKQRRYAPNRPESRVPRLPRRCLVGVVDSPRDSRSIASQCFLNKTKTIKLASPVPTHPTHPIHPPFVGLPDIVEAIASRPLTSRVCQIPIFSFYVFRIPNPSCFKDVPIIHRVLKPQRRGTRPGEICTRPQRFPTKGVAPIHRSPICWC